MKQFKRYFNLSLYVGGILFIGYLSAYNILYYLYRYLGSEPPFLNRLLFMIIQGYDIYVNQVKPSYSSVLVLVFLSIIPFIFLMSKQTTEASVCDLTQPHSRICEVGLVVPIVIAILITGRRYLILSHPAGFDTPLYIAEILKLQRSGLDTNSIGYLGLSGLFYPLTFIGITAERVVELIPILLTILNVLVTYKFVEIMGFQGCKVQLLAASFVPLSLTIIRQTADLYKSLLTYSFLLALFILYCKYVSDGKITRAILINAGAAYLMLYVIGWVYLFLTMVLFSLVRYLRYREGLLVRRTVVCFVSSLILVVGLLPTPYSVVRYIAYLTANWSWISNPSSMNLYALIQQPTEQTPIVLLSLLGLISLVRTDKKTPPSHDLLLAYCFVLDVSVLLTDVYRNILYIPFPILSALGIKQIFLRSKMGTISFRFTHRKLGVNRKTIIALLIFSLVISNALVYEDNTTESTGYPPKAVVNVLFWIANNIGRNSVIIVNQWNAQVNWIAAFIPPRTYRGDVIYLGTVHGFIGGLPSRLDGYPMADPTFFNNSYYDFLRGRLHVLVIDGFYYRVNDSEKSILLPIYKEDQYTVYALRESS